MLREARSMNAQTAIVWVWGVWYWTWIAAVIFSSRTKVQMRRDAAGLHRALASIGVLLLFVPNRWSHAGALARPLWTVPPGVEWGLLALVVAGFGFCWWARLHLGRLWSGFVTLKEDHHIVDTGPYALVRHPIYSGVMFSALMTALMKVSPASLVGCVMVCVGFAMTARIEEGFLRGQLGAEAYDAYSRRVPMLIPRLG
jgi:protein-S-isoprenylcysteine O-methyltransferase Ste14